MKLIFSNKPAGCWFNFQRINMKYDHPFARKFTDARGTTHDKGIQKSYLELLRREYLGLLLNASISNHLMKKLPRFFISSTNQKFSFHSGFPCRRQKLGVLILW